MRRCNLLCALLLSWGCNSDKSNDWGVPTSQPDDSPVTEPATEQGDTSSTLDDDWAVGDAIQTIATFPDPPTGQIVHEWVDVAIYDEQYAVQVGVSGIGLVRRSDGQVLDSQNPSRGYSVDSNGDLIVMGSRTQRISLWRFQDPERLNPAGFIDGQGIHEKVAVSSDLVAVAWRDQGLRLYSTNTENTLVAQISGTDVYAVDICGPDLFYSDLNELVWVSLTDPNSPIERERIVLESEVRDIECNEEYVALGLGGNGVQVFSKLASLSEIDVHQPPGAVFSVSLDGDYLWAAAWAQTVLYAIDANGLIPLTHEKPISSAMGVAASDGQAIVADWLQSTVLHQNLGVLGPEVHLPSQLYFRPGDAVSQPLWIQNHGSRELEIAFVNPPPGFGIAQAYDDSTSAVIPPGETEIFSVTVPEGEWNPVGIRWESNDPDEPSGLIDIQPALTSVGSLHPDFALPIVNADGLQGTARLADYQDKVLFLAWWSDF